ncbi:hypothetical protein EIN_131880 [Entamoeba invadens IP1]|uniref:Uncharacterized protein n=1 Tax=Entamoeba invadens IP1 TaxID=370355 RepID=A0A0A1UDB3_ENTIV|nr:hypothetical protein EIN_131880 [Entamoeba invadens IP1]ELP94339.1 hypothetical protein EIN_131880 [Entamoeba invadens IP1]|eukprot:XP_004261110.1 hypothetical protein EIN_131880 [Entamoeba invadens IP1]
MDTLEKIKVLYQQSLAEENWIRATVVKTKENLALINLYMSYPTEFITLKEQTFAQVTNLLTDSLRLIEDVTDFSNTLKQKSNDVELHLIKEIEELKSALEQKKLKQDQASDAHLFEVVELQGELEEQEKISNDLQTRIEHVLFEVEKKSELIETLRKEVLELKSKQEEQFRQILCSTVGNGQPLASKQPPKRRKKRTVLFPSLAEK